MKMSDALRAAAETAPVDDVHVSASAAARRVKRSRAVRAGANGIAGVGAAGLVVAGVMGALAGQSGLASIDGAGGDAGAPEPAIGTEGQAISPNFGDRGLYACGQAFDPAAFSEGPITAAYDKSEVGEALLTYDISYSATADAWVTLGEPVTLFVWKDIVVGVAGGSGYGAWEAQVGDSAMWSIDAKALNCWDGKELPAGDYTVVSVTPVVENDDQPVASDDEPQREPDVVEPDGEGAGVDANASVELGGGDDSVTFTPATSSAVATFEITIPGDPADDPFGEYLNGDPQPVDPGVPADALNAKDAIDAYNKALKLGRWDMAPGTQRVVMTGSSDNPDADWTASYFGCPMDGAGGGFPAASAELDWLDVKGSVPGGIHVSYGWIVDDNPPVSLSVTNNSPWSIPGFYGGAQSTLYLVKDGKVVAEAYPVGLDQHGGGVVAYGAAEDAGRSIGSADAISAPVSDGWLKRGDSLSGDYLWRDLYGCWDNASQVEVGAGTYTVLNVQSIYVGGGMFMPIEEGAGGSEGADTGRDVAPAPEVSDYASFQVWTSLGTVTISK